MNMKQNLRYSKNPDPDEILKILKTANPEPAMRKAWQAKYDAMTIGIVNPFLNAVIFLIGEFVVTQRFPIAIDNRNDHSQSVTVDVDGCF